MDDTTRLNELRTALEKARTTEAVYKALLTVARSDYERARDARRKCAASLDAEWQRTPGAQRAESVAELFERGRAIVAMGIEQNTKEVAA
jgi:hypothetical protein